MADEVQETQKIVDNNILLGGGSEETLLVDEANQEEIKGGFDDASKEERQSAEEKVVEKKKVVEKTETAEEKVLRVETEEKAEFIKLEGELKDKKVEDLPEAEQEKYNLLNEKYGKKEKSALDLAEDQGKALLETIETLTDKNKTSGKAPTEGKTLEDYSRDELGKLTKEEILDLTKGKKEEAPVDIFADLTADSKEFVKDYGESIPVIEKIIEQKMNGVNDAIDKKTDGILQKLFELNITLDWLLKDQAGFQKPFEIAQSKEYIDWLGQQSNAVQALHSSGRIDDGLAVLKAFIGGGGKKVTKKEVEKIVVEETKTIVTDTKLKEHNDLYGQPIKKIATPGGAGRRIDPNDKTGGFAAAAEEN